MIDLAHPLQGASRKLAKAVPFRPFRLALDQPIVSFTFDDFPLSAAQHAAPVLEQYGARGTFYFADQLAGRHENEQLIASPEAASRLARLGHEIGGHTSGHLNVQRVLPADLRADVAANDAAIAALTGQAPRSFAYPFGVLSLGAKRLLARRYGALRGIQPGVNRGWIDMAHLHADELYDSTLSPEKLGIVLDDLQRRPGWLIFYTHEVTDRPSSIGCSPDHFAAVVERVAARGVAIKTVASVLDQLGVAAPNTARTR